MRLLPIGTDHVGCSATRGSGWLRADPGRSGDRCRADKRLVIEATARGIDALVLLSEVLNYDFASKPIDEPFTDDELVEFSFQGFRDRVIRHSGRKNPTVR